ncbi:MAG: tRNA pseudouridine(38-40) synthase TruA [Bacteroidia bacterium]
MYRYFLKLAYNGKNYHGWQVQQNAHSVQAEIENKLEILLKQKTEITGCGRTDTGVHAKEYYAHMDLPFKMNCDKITFQLNALLPDDIVIYNIFLVEPNLHARFDATYREYQYIISTIKTPFYKEFCWEFTRPLNITLMNEASNLLLQHTNFECFSKVNTQVKTFICNVSKANWQLHQNGELIFTIGADRFLRNMVRAIVGTLIDIGLQKITILDFKEILNSNNRCKAGQSVPAQGLFLTKVNYPNF